MKGFFVTALLIVGLTTYSQTLAKKFTWKTNTVSNAKIEWIDINNDSLLDVLVLAKGVNQKLQVSSYKNNLTSFVLTNNQELDVSLNSYSVVDLNNDNKQDLVINGFKSNQQTYQLINQSNFQFVSSAISIIPLQITQQAWADFNLDGKMDWVVGGTNFLKIFQSTTNGYVLKLDSIGLNVASIVTGDFTKDGKIDLVVSGSKIGKPFTSLLKNKNKFLFQTIPISRGLQGSMEKGDFNQDGNFDIVGSGLNAQLKNLINYYAYKDDKFIVVDSLKDHQPGQLSIADINSDGLTELSYLGKRSNGAKRNFVRDTSKVITDLDTTQIAQQKWGDFDRDGDLDILRVRDSSTYQVFEIFENQSMTINNAPIKGDYSFWASVFNKTILYWSPFKDDLTVAKSLTYDLRVTRHSEILVTGLFDINNEKSRLTPSNGYQLTNTFIILPGKGCPTYFIQSVDNAFNGSKLLQLQCSNGNSCPSDITTAQVQACKDTNTIIGTDEEAHWFSFNNGFKGISKKLIFKADQPDTIVSVIVGNQCPKVKAYIIQVNEGSKNEMETKYVCAGKPTKIGIPTGWSNVVWDYEGKSLTSDTIVVSLLKPLVVSVAATSGNCQYKKQFNLNISDFDLKLDSDSYIINQGESAQLGASGGSKYEWLPNVALSNNKVANPVASPIQTIQYEVTALDSINCSKKASVKVEVINTGFLPNLFTPNGDGKNDDYKILGLYGATDFEFVIYNREGTIVYETTSWQTATSLGWNGQKGGVNQPSGLYYWKVQGKQPNGQTLLLNGKSTGSVLLIR